MLVLEIAGGIILGGIVLAVLWGCFTAGTDNGTETGLIILLALGVGGGYLIFGKVALTWIGALLLIGFGLWITVSTLQALQTWWHRRMARRLGISLGEYEWRRFMKSYDQPITAEGWANEKETYERMFPDG